MMKLQIITFTSFICLTVAQPTLNLLRIDRHTGRIANPILIIDPEVIVRAVYQTNGVSGSNGSSNSSEYEEMDTGKNNNGDKLQWGEPCNPTGSPYDDPCTMSSITSNETTVEQALYCDPNTHSCQCLPDDNSVPIPYSQRSKKCLLPVYYACQHASQCESNSCDRATIKDYDRDPSISPGYPNICKPLNNAPPAHSSKWLPVLTLPVIVFKSQLNIK